MALCRIVDPTPEQLASYERALALPRHRLELSVTATPALLAACEEAAAWIASSGCDLALWLDRHAGHPQHRSMTYLCEDATRQGATWAELLAEVRLRPGRGEAR